MARNVELGDGCRTVFLPTVPELSDWWERNRDWYPVMAYYTSLNSELAPCHDGNHECEWIAGPSIVAVVRKMVQHLGISTDAVWKEGYWDGNERIPGWWQIPDFDDCPDAPAACVCGVSDTEITASVASDLILTKLPGLDQEILRLYVGAEMDEFVASESEMRDECIEDGGLDFYGVQNEGRNSQQESDESSAESFTSEDVLAELRRMLDQARLKFVNERVPGSLFVLAQAALQGRTEAVHWFITPAQELDEQVPIEAIRTEVGALLVREVLERIGSFNRS